MSSRIIKCKNSDGEGVGENHYKLDENSNSESLSEDLMMSEEYNDFSINTVRAS